MNIVIRGVPRFEISATPELVATLIKLAGHHYDGTCKAAAEVGGFLYGWRNSLSPPVPTSFVSGSFRDLDLTLKICEVARYAQLSEVEKSALGEYITAVHYALRRSNEVCKGWVDRD